MPDASGTPAAPSPEGSSSPAMSMPPELSAANSERDAAVAELDATKREHDLQSKTTQDRVNVDAAVTPVRQQTEFQLSKATEMRDRIKGRETRPRAQVFALDKVAAELEKVAVGGGGYWPRTYGPPKTPKPNTYDPISWEPNIYNNREMALDDVDGMYGAQTKPITSGRDWATKGIQNRHQQQVQQNRAMGYPDNAKTLTGAWNKWVAAPHQYMAGTLADLGQNMWRGAGKNVAGNYAGSKAGWQQMKNQVIHGAAASPKNLPGKIMDGLGSLRLDTAGDWWGDTWRTVANVTPLGLGGYQDPRQRQRDEVEKQQQEAQLAAAQQQAPTPPQPTATEAQPQGQNNFQDLMMAMLPFLGMNNQMGGANTYGYQPDHSGDFINLMRVMGNMNRAQ